MLLNMSCLLGNFRVPSYTVRDIDITQKSVPGAQKDTLDNRVTSTTRDQIFNRDDQTSEGSLSESL